MALYSNLFLSANGVLLSENATVETELTADIQDVATMVKGWAGITPAPITRTVNASSFIPLAGAEFDFEQKYLDSEEVELMMQEAGSGKKCVTKGYFKSVTRSAGVGQNATIAFTFTGSKSAFK